ncbi:hypothetical protein IQ274_25755 [Nostoc sp. LEGE 12447]|uniref:hypothetical protein n=1 Tax=Nostoc sp. LEGE 12447 TaxID=1828640 RepID=UPI0018842402|nr:hypothetical protein [Nostoc sp. LEGE 12447]MBE9001527.1 hypothetical protein [Nostoc sp. LEGE 12447]
MVDKLDLTPEKVRIKDSYRERIFAESQQLGKSYLETLYFIIDCYFVFIKAGLATQQVAFTPITTEPNKLPSMTSTPFAQEKEEDSSSETFSLDFDL